MVSGVCGVFSVIGTTNNTPLTPLCRQGGRSLSAGYQNLDKQTVLQDQMPQHTKCFFAVWLNCSFNMSSVMWMIMLHWMTTFERTLALLCERFLLKWCLIPQFFCPWRLLILSTFLVAYKSLEKTKTNTDSVRLVTFWLPVLSVALSPEPTLPVLVLAVSEPPPSSLRHHKVQL